MKTKPKMGLNFYNCISIRYPFFWLFSKQILFVCLLVNKLCLFLLNN